MSDSEGSDIATESDEHTDVFDFIALPDAPAEQIERIISIRTEVVDNIQKVFPNIHFVGDAPPPNEQSECPQNCLVIERSLKGSKATVESAYGLTYASLDFVRSHPAYENDYVKEESEILQLTLSLLGADVVRRGSQYRQVRPLRKENALLRSALGIGRMEKVDARSVKKAKKTLVNNAVAQHTSSITIASTPTPAPVPQSQPQPSSEAAAAEQQQSLHSPLLWEMETEAAINARTKYNPYKLHAGSVRRLDAVTQQQLVTRLHDKSVDQRSKRLQENEDKVHRALGLSEHKVLTTEEQFELGARLHDRQRDHSKNILAELQDRYLKPLNPKRTFTPEEQHVSNERIYAQPMEKSRNIRAHLVEIYVTSRDLEKHRLSPDQQQKMADRLSSRGRKM